MHKKKHNPSSKQKNAEILKAKYGFVDKKEVNNNIYNENKKQSRV